MILDLAVILTFQALIFIKLRRLIMTDVPSILAQLATLNTTVASIPVATPPVDLQPISDAITAIQTEADAKAVPAG